MNLFDLVVLAVGLVVILVGAELFTNGIEWFGHKLNLAEGAVGSVLAAVGTALPETMIPIVAIVFSGAAATDPTSGHGVGVGAILGAPFMLGTLAMFVTGVAVWTMRRRRTTGDEVLVDRSVLRKDVLYFFASYGVAVLTAFLPSDAGALRVGAAILLIGMYAIYVRAHFVADPNVDLTDIGHLREELTPLRLRRLDPTGLRLEPGAPRLRIVNLQVLLALGLILAGAVVFVDSVEHLASALGIPPIVLALIIAPIATELPEKFNSVIWVRQGKDTLALGNITGAMVFQSCIPTVFGLLLAADAWKVDFSSTESLLSFASAGIAFISMTVIFLPMIRGAKLTSRALMLGGALYAVYLALVLAFVAGVF
jgi:cation:H+ antiporter